MIVDHVIVSSNLTNHPKTSGVKNMVKISLESVKRNELLAGLIKDIVDYLVLVINGQVCNDVPYKNDNELYEKLEFLKNNESEIFRIAENGYNNVLKNHSYKNRANRLIEIIKENLDLNKDSYLNYWTIFLWDNTSNQVIYDPENIVKNDIICDDSNVFRTFPTLINTFMLGFFNKSEIKIIHPIAIYY